MKRLNRFRKAAALPFVLLLVALNVTVVVALLIYATTELQASRNSVQAEAARAMAQSGIDIAAGLIAANSTNNGFVTYQRVTNDGAWRLETKIANVVAPNSALPWKKVPTNQTILHSGFASGSGGVDLNFPVAGDPSAGFIAPRVNTNGWQNLSSNMFRMEWIYVYATGSTNPVGRFAYWVDDESTKLNINYSGMTNSYNLADYSKNAISAGGYVFPSNRPAGGAQFNARIWPMDMELGGIGGLSRSNAVNIISNRKAPWFPGFRPYPSVLATRIADSQVVTNVLQQSSMGFTATVYSREEERSYSTGKRRFDLLTTLTNSAPTNVISDFQSSILADNPQFAAKYAMPAFAWAAYDIIQAPSGGGHADPFYVRGAPVLNEVSLKVACAETNGTNKVNVTAEAELIILAQQDIATPYLWGSMFNGTNQNKVSVEILLGNAFGIASPIVLNGQTNAAQWFHTYTDGSGTYNGPNDTNLSTAIATLSNSIAATSPVAGFQPPTNITVYVKHDGRTNQAIAVTGIPTNGIVAPAAGQTNIYHLVAQPRSDGGYRGDPRLGAFTYYQRAADNTTNFSALGLSTSIGSLNTSNPTNATSPGNWQPDAFSTDPNQPDLMASQQAFSEDRGMANLSQSISAESGLARRFAGIGWIGEVPVTSTSGNALGFSTPRLWGNGRSSLNGHDFPPDWLLLDSLHMAPASTNTSGAFESFGRVNANGLKTFFQTPLGSTTRGDTIMDSVIINARTRDWRHGASTLSTIKTIPSTDATRVPILNLIQDAMIKPRNAADNPYATHFEFLADLAGTNPASPVPAWWFAPTNSSGSIYAATNTTDRRIESIVRSLSQKFTTHGNQFSIFSLGQALQVVNGQTNIVGEAYLQAVYERAPVHDEATGAITNTPTGAPPMRQLYLRELRY